MSQPKKKKSWMSFKNFKGEIAKKLANLQSFSISIYSFWKNSPRIRNL